MNSLQQAASNNLGVKKSGAALGNQMGGKFNPMGERNAAQQMVEKNRASHIVYAAGSKAQTGQGQNMKTSNQSVFRWIQPVQ